MNSSDNAYKHDSMEWSERGGSMALQRIWSATQTSQLQHDNTKMINVDISRCLIKVTISVFWANNMVIVKRQLFSLYPKKRQYL